MCLNKELLTFCAFLSLGMLTGQVNLLIEDQTEQGFYLGINGYLQNPEKQQHILIESLDTVPYKVHIDSDNFNFVKRIHLREPQTHRYVLTHDFHGNLKLRYRGIISSAPNKVVRKQFDHDLNWPEEWQPVASLADSIDQPEITAAKKPEVPQVSNEPIKAAQAEIDKDLELATSEIEKAEALSPALDTLPKAEDSVAEKEVGKTTFEGFLAELRSKQYEFERLTYSLYYAKKNTLNVTQLEQVFDILSYDQTRLQFFREVRAQVRDPGNLAELEDELEYEISKKEFQKLINHE